MDATYKKRMDLCMKKKLFLIGVSFCLITSVRAVGFVREYIAPPVKGQVHASTVVEIENGYFVAWFEGSKESAADVSIKGAARIGGKWSEKRVIAKVNEESPHWNPVLRKADDGRLCLYFKVGRNCSDWRTYTMESFDQGKNWSAPRELVQGDVSGGRGPVKNKCLQLFSGRLLAGASREFDPSSMELKMLWRSFVDISDDDGRTWRRSQLFPVPENMPSWGEGKPFGVIQPTLWEDGKGVHALLRSTDGWVWRTDSVDSGETWNICRRTSLQNLNSGLDCVYASDNKLYLVLNGPSRVTRPGGWGPRDHLEIMVSPDSGESWNSFMVLENGKGKKPDAPWVEYSYPAIIESRSGSLIVTYTSKRKQICFCEILLCSKKKD